MQANPRLTRISHGPVRNAHGVPTFVGVSRESFRPGKLLPKQLATGDLLTNRKICEKVRLKPRTVQRLICPVGTPAGRIRPTTVDALEIFRAIDNEFEFENDSS